MTPREMIAGLLGVIIGAVVAALCAPRCRKACCMTREERRESWMRGGPC